jgi:hypothetical protein
MNVYECSVKKELPFTIDVSHIEELKDLNRMGEEIANNAGLHYEGYYLFTIEPYSPEKARPILFFN